MLEPHSATGRPVIVTEFGMRTYRDADTSGALGFGVTDPEVTGPSSPPGRRPVLSSTPSER